MKKNRERKSGMNVFAILLLSSLMVIGLRSVSHAEWSYGIGTGMFMLNIDGTMGLHTTLAGPVDLDIDLDPSDVRDLIDTAIGFGGYASDGTWMIKYSYQKMKLEGEETTFIPSIASTVYSKINFDATGAEVIVSYPVYKMPSAIFTVDGGLRYTKHELSSVLTFSGAQNGTLLKELDNSWTDLVIGASAIVPLAPQWTWTTSVNAGFGGSEGTYQGYTGVNWRFLENWSAALFGKYTAIEYEDSSRGATDWYLYDADEFGMGISVLFNF